MSSIRKKAIEGFKVNDSFTISRTFTEQDMVNFADITRDYNPVHFDDRFAEVKSFDGRICHGLLVGSMLTEIGGQIGWLASRMDFRFKKPIYFNDTITCSLTITDIDDRDRANAEAVFKNQNEDTVLVAYLSGILPGSQEKQILDTMRAEGDPSNKLC
jgi:acyl dehydratase